MIKQLKWVLVGYLFFVFFHHSSFSKGDIVLKKWNAKIILQEHAYLNYNIKDKPKNNFVVQDSLYANYWRIEEIQDSLISVSKVVSFRLEQRPLSFKDNKENLLVNRAIAIDSLIKINDTIFYYYLFPDSIEKLTININGLNNIFVPKSKRGAQLLAYATLAASSLLITSCTIGEYQNLGHRFLDGLIGGIGLFSGIQLFRYKTYGIFELEKYQVEFTK